MEERELKNIVKKLLATTAAVVVMSGSLGVGTLRVLAEQYYGWNDGTREQSPFFLYVSPTSDPKRELKDEYVVYCFNKNMHWPDQWESIYKNFNDIRYPYNDLPIYEKKLGSNDIFKQYASNYKKDTSDIASALVAVLSNGYPTNKSQLSTSYKLDNDSSRKVTQLAIWYFSDSLTKEYLENTGGYNLSEQEKKALDFLISKGEDSKLKSDQNKYSLDIYIYQNSGYEYKKDYQNLLGSTLVPKTPEEPKPDVPKEPEVPEQPEVPDIDVEIIKPEIPTEPLVEPMLPLQPAIPITPKPEIPKEEDLGTVIGGGNVVETTEDTATGSQGGAYNGVVSIQENKDPIVEETYDSPLPGQSGQSGSKTEVEDTKVPEVIIGGQGEVVDIEETLPTEQGQSGSTTEVEDTKGPEVIIGGQGEVVDIEESLPTEHGQSGSTTEVEDSKPKLSIHFDNEWPKEDKPQLPAVEKPKAKESLPAAGEAEHVLSTIVGAMILFLVSLWGLLKRKASKA